MVEDASLFIKLKTKGSGKVTFGDDIKAKSFVFEILVRMVRPLYKMFLLVDG